MNNRQWFFVTGAIILLINTVEPLTGDEIFILWLFITLVGAKYGD